MGRALQRQCPVARPGRIRDIPEYCHWGNSQEKLFLQVQAQRGNVRNSNQGGNEIKPLGLGLTYGWRYSPSYAAHHDLGNEYASPDFQHLTTCSLLRKNHPSSLAFFAYQDTHKDEGQGMWTCSSGITAVSRLELGCPVLPLNISVQVGRCAGNES